jgi:hypothetical protein
MIVCLHENRKFSNVMELSAIRSDEMNLFILTFSLALSGFALSCSFSFAQNHSLTYEDPSLGFRYPIG